jgi:hypothetical protein
VNEPLIIRQSTEEDGPALLRLAALDSARAPHGPALVAFVGTELRAALPLDGGRPIADPFHRTADLVELLHARAELRGRVRAAFIRRPALRPRAA